MKNGVSALGLQRVLGLGSYETAWTWLHKLRRAMMRHDRDRISGEVEIYETDVGSPEEGMRGRQVKNKGFCGRGDREARQGYLAHPPSLHQECLRRKLDAIRPGCNCAGLGYSLRRMEGL